MNLWDILLLAVIALAVFFAIRRLRKNKGTCGCGCADCPSRTVKHSKICGRNTNGQSDQTNPL